MWLYPIGVNKNVHKYISPKLCLTPEIKSKNFRIGECVGICQTTVHPLELKVKPWLMWGCGVEGGISTTHSKSDTREATQRKRESESERENAHLAGTCAAKQQPRQSLNLLHKQKSLLFSNEVC